MDALELLEKHHEKTVNSSTPSKEYLHKIALYQKYSWLGFRIKAGIILNELDKIKPAPTNNFLWVSLNLCKLEIQRTGIDTHGSHTWCYGLMIEKSEEKRKALVLLDREWWTGDIPEEILDHACLNIHNFKSLYVAPVISGYVETKQPYIDIITKDLNDVALIQRVDPILFGSYNQRIMDTGPTNLAVLGVWGKDWYKIKTVNEGQYEYPYEPR